MNIFTILLIQPLTNGLAVFYNLTNNMGLAILGFSLFLRLALIPLTKPYIDSMKKMKDYKEDLDKLKKRHKDDRAKLMKAQSDFYKQKGINPGAGCLPMVLQFVVLIALFRVFTSVLSANGDTFTKFNTLLYEPLKYSEEFKFNMHFLYMDVTEPDVIDINGLPFAIPGPLVIGAALFQFLGAKITQPYMEEEKKIAKKTKEKEDDIQVAMQSSMIYTFPLMTLFIGMRFPSGLALYWLMFSIFQLTIQFRSSGWGGLTPYAKKFGLVEKTS